MLNWKKVLGAKPKDHVESKLDTLLSPWGESLDPAHVLEEHPTPQFVRLNYTVLNGYWDYAIVSNGHDPSGDLEETVAHTEIPSSDAFAKHILVPFSPEAELSGVRRQLKPDELLWYRRSFAPPVLKDNERLILHFQAVDYACAIFINNSLLTTHAGAYTPFSIDVTDELAQAENEILVCVADPSEYGAHLRGKQRIDRGDIWYTAQSGIWQTVWYEVVPELHIDSVVIEPELETGILSVGVRIAGFDDLQTGFPSLHLRVFDHEGALVANASCEELESVCAIALHIPEVRPWSPDDPYLYTLEFQLGEDCVNSYCGFRSVEVHNDEQGVPRVFINGEPLFLKGVLDQGYWSDGLMTAPADDALVHDIATMHDAGFNLMRKHIKVEQARWYYHCDKMGMLVLQDIPSGGGRGILSWQWSYKPTLFKASWNRFRDDTPGHRRKLGAGDELYRIEWLQNCSEIVQLLGNHPSVIAWSLFNEGWGQFDARKACDMVRRIDSSRLIDASSGWYDQGCGDFHSVHNYFRDLVVWRDRKHNRPFFISEFGGLTHHVDGHSSLSEAYGYEPFEDILEWRYAYREMIAQADLLCEQGLVGYVYTQVSDVEEETNGLLSYDRKVNKLVDE